MNNGNIDIPEHRFFRLPFEYGNLKLTRNILDAHSKFRKPRSTYLHVRAEMVSFIDNTLTFSITIENEDEEMVYLKVTDTHLLVSCSVDTDATYLSRHAYFLLDNYLNYHYEKDMDVFYWPDFFDAEGKSKFLKIERNANAFEIKLKDRYRFFYKPGLMLPLLSGKYQLRSTGVSRRSCVADKPINQMQVTAYCLLDPLNLRIQSQENKELTLLIPLTTTLNKDQKSFRTILRYLHIDERIGLSELEDDQHELNVICHKMWENTLYYQAKNVRNEISSNNYQQRNIAQFKLWEMAFPILLAQRYVCYQAFYGLRYIKEKPTKKDFRACRFSPEIPVLKFFLIDRGDYYRLEIKFSVNGRVFKFASNLATHYFAASDIDPKRFYLLGSPEDAELVTFFAQREFSLPILKKHFHSHFSNFADKVHGIYGIKAK